MDNKARIQAAKEKCLKGILLDKSEMIALLAIDSGPDYDLLLNTAFEVAAIKTGKKAYLWGAIGIDYAGCPMNCDFCSFGSKWGIVKEEQVYTPEQVIEEVRAYVTNNVHYIVFRTTQFYSIDQLAALAIQVRKAVPGSYEIILNVGEFGQETADKLPQAGVNGIYHAIRLREGIDTRFNVDERRKTLAAVRDSPLKLIHLVEPVGEEHSNDEIADRFLEAASFGTCISGIMARIPVKGTPLGDTSRISDHRIAGLIAVLRLSGGHVVQDICVHPASPLAIKAGANVVVVEKGAIPRDDQMYRKEWNQFHCSDAISLFEANGYTIS